MADMVIWCPGCGGFVHVDESWTADRLCPGCGTHVPRNRCSRCGADWVPREPAGWPLTCPRCRSPYWNRARVR